ncbi:MAG: NAD(P)-binding domain-containing protein, partial [Actinomycetota bacterium]|nr:NAD(P)-binding domain-containing protein [Actinomycetota bacterium]
MRIGILGTGTVGTTLAGKLRELGHEVRVGSRDGSKGDATFAEVAAHGEVLLNCTAGVASLAALEQAGEDNLRGKVLVDVANPLDFSGGFPPRLSVCNDDSLAEQIQRRFPEARVVKALNTIGAPVMVDPGIVPGAHTIFVAGDDAAAKEQVVGLLESMGWSPARVMDLGGIGASRGLEMYLPLWLSLFGRHGSPLLNVQVLHGAAP